MKPRAVLCAILLTAPAAWGADTIPPTLERSLELGLRTHPGLRAARLAVEAAEARAGEARAARLPALVLSGSAARVSDEEAATVDLPAPMGSVSLGTWIQDRVSLGASLRQNLFSGFAVRSRVEAAAALAEAARSDLAAEEGRVACEIETAWWSLAAAVEAAAVVEESRRLLVVHLGESEQYLAQGLATREELLRAASELAQTEARLAEAASAERLARRRLALLVGLGPDAEGGPTAVGSVEAAGAPLAELVAAALAGRAELAAIDRRVRAGAAAADGARSGWYPSVALEGALVWARPNPMLFPPQDRFEATWQIGLAASLNIGGYVAVERRVREAEAETERLRAQRQARAMQVTLEVSEASESVRRAAERIAAAAAAAARAEETLRVVRGKASSGLARASQLLDAELELMRARLEGTKAAADLGIAAAALRQATGARR